MTSFRRFASTMREYQYQIDLQGSLYLADVKIRTHATAYRDPKFLDFFISNLRLRNCQSLKLHGLPQFQYESRCGAELNLVQSEDSPIVFKQLNANTQNLEYAGTFITPFHPKKIHFSAKTGRLYHPLPEKMQNLLAPWQLTNGEKTALGLLRSQLVQIHFAESIDETSISWEGMRYSLIKVND
ncbi:hypothetical protein HK100_007006 [Physocladia obscura]|uniref:Uncharacterized protein n=1 Tax=Physocladia obscura TaxID=109957 RepID=A0AAD5T595_9FUNG|nr:hypothetical protein HK100_007006 [Physocladia obscura]